MSLSKSQKITKYDGDPNDLTTEQLKHLEELYCSHLEIEMLPKGMINLRILECNDSVNLKSLPDDMFNLEVLDCYNCDNIKSLPDDMIKLRELTCAYMGLVSLPKDMFNLRELDCTGNELTSLPKGILIKLKVLNCCENFLTSLPEGMINLEELECSYNRLEDLPYDMAKLEKLGCIHNPPEVSKFNDDVELYHTMRKIILLLAHNKRGSRMVLNNDLVKKLKEMLY